MHRVRGRSPFISLRATGGLGVCVPEVEQGREAPRIGALPGSPRQTSRR